MFDNKIPKYSKVEIKLKKTNILMNDGLKSSVPNGCDVVQFDDAGLVVTGNFLIVVLDEKNAENALSSTGKVFKLDDIISYKTYNQ